MADRLPYLVRYLKRFATEIFAEMKADRVFKGCLALAALAYVYLNGGSLHDNCQNWHISYVRHVMGRVHFRLLLFSQDDHSFTKGRP